MDTIYLEREEITENVIVIKINRSYKETMSETALYDVTRGYWKLNLKRAKQAEYAFSVYKGEIKEVYKIDEWLPAGSIPRPTLSDAEVPADRYEFTGKVAENAIRNKYVGKSIAHLHRKGDANPTKYLFNEEISCV